MRVNISIDEDLLKEFDGFCGRYRFTRSEFISALMRATVYDDFTLKGVRIITRKLTGKEVNIQGGASIQNETPPKIMSGDDVAQPVVEKVMDEDGRQYSLKALEGWCQGHFEKGVTYKRYLVTWEDENGEVKIDHRWYCESCLRKVFNFRKGKIYEER